jgi:hypothetical protein
MVRGRDDEGGEGGEASNFVVIPDLIRDPLREHSGSSGKHCAMDPAVRRIGSGAGMTGFLVFR